MQGAEKHLKLRLFVKSCIEGQNGPSSLEVIPRELQLSHSVNV